MKEVVTEAETIYDYKNNKVHSHVKKHQKEFDIHPDNSRYYFNILLSKKAF